MHRLYLDKKVDIRTKTDKQPFDWFKNNHVKYIKKLVFIVISCLAVISQISGPYIAFAAPSESIKPSLPPDDNYLLDRVITWADGSKEHVQIGKDGFFRLDGVKKRLVGMFLSKLLPYGKLGQFYLPENLSILDKELSYLESIGVRLVRIELQYVRWWLPNTADEKVAYTAFLDLSYKHKMFVIAAIDAKWIGGFNCLEVTDFITGFWTDGKWVATEDSLGQWAERCASIAKGYQNVIGICAENELDLKLKVANYSWIGEDQNYTPERVADYMAFLIGILRQVGVPITHNLMGNQIEPEIKQVCLHSIDIPSFDCYEKTPEILDTVLTSFLSSVGTTTGWWCLELNYGGIEKDYGKTEWVIDTSKFSGEYIDTVFSQGAAVAILSWSNDTKDERRGFFDKDGMPKLQLVEVAVNINSFQAAINESLVALEKR